jgi:hypothetical protein
MERGAFGGIVEFGVERAWRWLVVGSVSVLFKKGGLPTASQQ